MRQDILLAIARTFVVFVLLLGLSRWMGRKLISQMTFFDFVVGVIIGSAAASVTLMQQQIPIETGLIVLVSLALLTVSVDYMNKKSFISRKITDSEPAVIIQNGEMIDENMRRLRLTIDELNMLLREKNVFNVSEVEFAIFESDGKLSVLKKSQYLPLTPSDLNLSTVYKGLTQDLIFDGKILEENLTISGLDTSWLIEKCREYGVSDIGQIFYGGLDTQGNLYISKKKDRSEGRGQYGIE